MRILIVTTVLYLFALTGASPALAQDLEVRCDYKGEDIGINTAIGCIPVLTDDPDLFLAWILTWAIGIAGGIAFLLILVAGFQIITSQGNPERMKAGQELLTAAVSGLLLLIFSIFILNFIGVDILGLPIGR